MQRCQLEGRYRNIDVVQLPYNRLELSVVYSVQGLDHLQVVGLLLIFHNSCFYRREVLLIRQVYVVKKGTFSRKKSARHLQGLCMPELRFLLLYVSVERQVFFHLYDEADLC